LFDADAAAMPFADQVFDYAICSHVLEHVEHPDAVIAELARVAKAGYIEVPEAASAKIVDFPSHLWWVTLDDGVLVFTAKSAAFFDADIDRYLTDSGMRQPLADLLDKQLDHRVIELPWRGTVACRVVGSPPAELVHAAHQADTQHREAETLAARLLTAAFTLPLRRHKHPGSIYFDDIVRPDLRTGTSEALGARVYRCD
jgi:SAM-dependent methyltransferase